MKIVSVVKNYKKTWTCLKVMGQILALRTTLEYNAAINSDDLFA